MSCPILARGMTASYLQPTVLEGFTRFVGNHSREVSLSSRFALLFHVASAGAIIVAGCAQGEGEVCQLHSDCESELVCCKPSASVTARGVCARSCSGMMGDAGSEQDAGRDAGATEDAGTGSDASMKSDGAPAEDAGADTDSAVQTDAGASADAAASTDAGASADAAASTDAGASADGAGFGIGGTDSDLPIDAGS
jgi:hypothetical protein